MADGSKFHFDGLANLNSALLGLEAKTGSALLMRAGKRAMAPVLQEMRQGAGVDAGELRDSLALRSSRAKGKSSDRIARVSAGSFRKSKGRGSNKKNLYRVAHKAIAQEYGTAKQSARPFIRPALENNVESVLRDLITEFGNELTKLK